MKKKIITTALLTIFLLGGCAKKEAITTQVFVDKAKEAGMTTEEVTSEYNLDNLEAVYAADSEEGTAYRFYDFADANAAADYYRSCETDIEAIIEDAPAKSSTSTRLGDNKTKTASADGMYYIAEQVGDTVLTVIASTEGNSEKANVDKFVKSIGY